MFFAVAHMCNNPTHLIDIHFPVHFFEIKRRMPQSTWIAVGVHRRILSGLQLLQPFWIAETSSTPWSLQTCFGKTWGLRLEFLKHSVTPAVDLNALKSSILVFLSLMSLSPVLRTLTAATSSDSIWALSAILFSLNILLADYSAMPTNEHGQARWELLGLIL